MKIIIKDKKILESPEFHKYFKVDIPMTEENIKNGIECEIIEPKSDKIKAGNIVSVSLNNDGMSLRDYFAAKAMSRIPFGEYETEKVAKIAYDTADAMLEAREK